MYRKLLWSKRLCLRSILLFILPSALLLIETDVEFDLELCVVTRGVKVVLLEEDLACSEGDSDHTDCGGPSCLVVKCNSGVGSA